MLLVGILWLLVGVVLAFFSVRKIVAMVKSMKNHTPFSGNTLFLIVLFALGARIAFSVSFWAFGKL